MRIAVCATGSDLESRVDSRLGRCAWFVVVNADTGEHESWPNDCAQGRSGAGVRVVQVLQERNVSVVLAEAIGPNAERALATAGITGYTGASGTVADAVRQFQAGDLAGGTGRKAGGGSDGPGRSR